MAEADVRERGSGKPRLLKTQCATCVLRPGNEARLRPGRLRELIRKNLRGTGLPCHETLMAGQQPALCRGFVDKFGHKVNYLRIVERLGGYAEVDAPPDPRVERES